VGLRIFDREHGADKGFRLGTHRARSPAETFAAYRPFLARAGITRIANITGLDYVGIPVYVAFRPNGRSLATSQGKGLDHDSARVSAMMEALEVWHAEHVELPARWDSYQHLRRTGAVIDIERLGVVRPPRLERPQCWVEGWDLLGQRRVWVPLVAVTMNFVATADGDILAGSNGLASGNHLLEAVLHGLSELIERDAEILWRAQPGIRLIDLDDVEEDYCRGLVVALRRAGVFVAAWDITSDVGVPACGALVMNQPEQNRWRVLGVHYGFGCHPDPAVALSRALSEAVQTRLTYISGSRDDFMRQNYEQASNPDLLAEIHAELTSEPPSMRLRDIPSLATARFEDDVQALLDRVRAVGVKQVVVVDLTRSDVGIPVVRVLAPGLEVPDTVPGGRARAAMAAAAAAEAQGEGE
jgi:YcaO-like protein with predicted kinase domain